LRQPHNVTVQDSSRAVGLAVRVLIFAITLLRGYAPVSAGG